MTKREARDVDWYKDLSDAELLVRSGTDAEAFGELYLRYRLSVLKFLYRRTLSTDTAADVAAETFARTFLARHQYRSSKGTVETWVLTIARNELARLARRQTAELRALKRLGIRRPSFDDETLERVEELVDAGPEVARLRQALAELSDPLKEAVRLRVGAELSYEEISERLHCSVGAARVRVFRGLGQLADNMEVSR